MAKQTINIGTVANDGTGDPLRTAFNKANENFTEVYDIANSAFAQANTGSNPFNQNLNTSNNVSFNQITVSSNVTADSIQLDISAGVSVEPGELAWNNSDGTLDIGIGYGDVVLQVGQETHYVVRNATGVQIENGTALYCTGVTVGSGRLEVSPMIGDGSVDPVQFIGLATMDINNGVNGVATWFGYVRGLDTRGTANTAISVGDEDWSVGDKLYVHPTAPGKLTSVEPEAPNTKICVAVVINRNQTAGVLFVRPTTNLVLSKLSDVEIDTPQDGQVLQYVSANTRWESSSNVTFNEVSVTGNISANTVNATTSFGLPVYATEAARDTAIPSPQPGMMVFVSSGEGAGLQVRGATQWNPVGGLTGE
jgi:hypothetical protein